MTLKEKNFYQQIHPLKLSTDILLGFYTAYLLWQHNIFLFLILFLIPSLLVTWLIVKFSDLEWLKRSSFGKYLSRYMTSPVVVIRITGQIIMWIAGWYHLFILIIAIKLDAIINVINLSFLRVLILCPKGINIHNRGCNPRIIRCNAIQPRRG